MSGVQTAALVDVAEAEAEAEAEAAETTTAASGLEVRLIRSDEYDAVDALVEAAYAHDYGPAGGDRGEMHSAEFRQREFDVWVAVDATGELVGSITARRKGGPALHEGVREGELDLRLLAVSPTARRRGVAAAIMREIIERARLAGWDQVGLKTAPNMIGAHRLYESLGFARDEARDGLWINGIKQFDLLMYVFPLAAAE